MDNSNILLFENITKKYPGIIALNKVNFDLKKGEIHGLVGKNGAGKSTLVSIMYGAKTPTEGKAYIINNDKKKEINLKNLTPKKAQKYGIYLVPQEPPFALDLSIEENFFMASPIMDNKFKMNIQEMKKITKKVIDDYNLNLDPSLKMSEVSMEDRHLLYAALISEIRDSDILLLDEVTAALPTKKKNILFKHLEKVRGEKTIIFISHRIDEILEICDRITVIRDGEKITTEKNSELNEHELADLIVGDNVEVPSYGEEFYLNNDKEEILFKLNNLSNKEGFNNVNLNIKKGEILGITGLKDSGASSLLRSLGGIDKIIDGSIELKGKEIELTSPKKAIDEGFIYCTDERIKEGILPDLSIKDNVNATIWDKITKLGFIESSKELNNFNLFSKKFGIKYSDYNLTLDSLSGGNQQKAMLARLDSAQPEIYLLDGPTKGIDVGAKYDILNILRKKIAYNGKTIILNMPNISDLMLVADRIVTFYEGEMKEEFSREEFNENNIYKSIQGV